MEHEERERQRAREEAMSYVRHAYRLGQRLPDKESEISHWSDAAVLYSTFVLKGPWWAVGGTVGKRAEQKISENARCARWYAQHVLKGPFPQAESSLVHDARQAALYAVKVLRGRYFAAENAIFGYEWAARYYVEHLPLQRDALMAAALKNEAKLQWALLCTYGETTDLVEAMGQTPAGARYYCFFKGHRISELEPMIGRSQVSIGHYVRMMESWGCPRGSLEDRKAYAVFSYLRHREASQFYENDRPFRQEAQLRLQRALSGLQIETTTFDIVTMLESPRTYVQVTQLFDRMTKPAVELTPALDVFSTNPEAGL